VSHHRHFVVPLFRRFFIFIPRAELAFDEGKSSGPLPKRSLPINKNSWNSISPRQTSKHCKADSNNYNL